MLNISELSKCGILLSNDELDSDPAGQKTFDWFGT
jgi:hypothetical protein